MEEKPRTIYFTDDPDTGIVHPEFRPEGESEFDHPIANMAALILSCFVLLVIIAYFFCSLFFK